jgi:hypothetical protein
MLGGFVLQKLIAIALSVICANASSGIGIESPNAIDNGLTESRVSHSAKSVTELRESNSGYTYSIYRQSKDTEKLRDAATKLRKAIQAEAHGSNEKTRKLLQESRAQYIDLKARTESKQRIRKQKGMHLRKERKPSKPKVPIWRGSVFLPHHASAPKL